MVAGQIGGVSGDGVGLTGIKGVKRVNDNIVERGSAGNGYPRIGE